ncbi:rRNA pseudouridine synthase [Eubacteriales bacterium OttesenSCG-928-N14]|nr:rRNA pseudouridine synthase [Eubacteriales bacterium OttesenSCG-928-N14]
MRLQKYLADCGIASRRASEKLMAEGRVTVNGEKTTTAYVDIDPAKDVVAVDGKRVAQKAEKVYYLFYKPRGVVCTMKDERGRKSLEHFFSKLDKRLFPVGRLDYDSEGLLLMTNDGDYANKIAHPSGMVMKQYRAVLSGHYSSHLAAALLEGVDIGDERTAAAQSIDYTNRQDGRAVVDLVIEEGRNRQVRRMFEAQGFEVVRLTRTAIGGIELPQMKPGSYIRLDHAQAQDAFLPIKQKSKVMRQLQSK